MTNQRGGKYVARGSFGCVYSPNLPCDTDGINIPQNMNNVSKVVKVDNLEEEWNPIDEFNLNRIDPDNEYFIYPTAACVISDMTINSDKEFYKCDLYKTKNRNIIKRNYANVIQPNGGVVSYKRKTDLNFENNWDLYIHLLIGLGILHKNSVYHRDIKEDNIVYSPVKGFRYIDFGVTLGYDSLPLVDNKLIDKEILFHKDHIKEARRAIPQLTVAVDRLTVQIRGNSSKSTLFRKSITKMREKIKKVKELRIILEGMKAKEEYHREHLSMLLDHRYNPWSDSKQNYFYWSKDIYILNTFLNKKEEISIYREDGSVIMSKYARFSSNLIHKANADYTIEDINITGITLEKMMTSYQVFLENVFLNKKYSSQKAFAQIMTKAIETFDIFSIGIFLCKEYKICTERDRINSQYRSEVKILIEKLVTLNPEDRPTIDEVITEFMIIIKNRLIKSGFFSKQLVKFNKLLKKIKQNELLSDSQLQSIENL
jgi:serine/threonine protein kinase